MEENLTLLPAEELPETDEPKKKKPKVNCLGEMVREFMDDYGLKDADMVKGTGIAWGTWHGWVTDDVNCQLVDENLFKLWMFVNKFKSMSLERLVYGVGTDEEENEIA